MCPRCIIRRGSRWIVGEMVIGMNTAGEGGFDVARGPNVDGMELRIDFGSGQNPLHVLSSISGFKFGSAVLCSSAELGTWIDHKLGGRAE